jgi:hypothetical protein
VSAFRFHRRYSNRLLLVNAPFIVEEDERGGSLLHIIGTGHNIEIAETLNEVSNLIEARGLEEPLPRVRLPPKFDNGVVAPPNPYPGASEDP